MTGFKEGTDRIVEMELLKNLERHGYVLEGIFKKTLRSRYGLSAPTISGALERVYTKIGLTKRRLTEELKRFYHLDISGHPVVYISI